MGLDTSTYSKATRSEEGQRLSNCGDHAGRLDPLEDGEKYSVEGLFSGTAYHSSYGGYNHFREELCEAALGVNPTVVWLDPDEYQASPFYEIIDFTDCDGILGPDACKALAADFAEHAERVLPGLSAYNQDGYRTFQAMFEHAADGGVVVFH